jgi:hypothetical protein
MLKLVIILFSFQSIIYCAEDLTNILNSNEWISNKEKTVEWLKVHNDKLYKNEKFTSLFGRCIIRYANNEAIMRSIDEESETIREKCYIVKEIGNSIVIQSTDPISCDEVPRIIEFNKERNEYSIFIHMNIYGNEIEVREFFGIYKTAQQGDAPEPASPAR